jgi:hypothetical protein
VAVRVTDELREHKDPWMEPCPGSGHTVRRLLELPDDELALLRDLHAIGRQRARRCPVCDGLVDLDGVDRIPAHAEGKRFPERGGRPCIAAGLTPEQAKHGLRTGEWPDD